MRLTHSGRSPELAEQPRLNYPERRRTSSPWCSVRCSILRKQARRRVPKRIARTVSLDFLLNQASNCPHKFIEPMPEIEFLASRAKTSVSDRIESAAQPRCPGKAGRSLDVPRKGKYCWRSPERTWAYSSD